MSKRINISSGTKWEDMFGYSRAVRVGNIIEIAGTTAVDENSQHVGEGDMYLQAKYVLQKIEKAIIAAGGQITDVVRTRIYVTDFSMFADLARAHSEVFAKIRPASSAIQAKLVEPGLLVEIEATAILAE